MAADSNSRTTAIGLARFAKEYLEAAILVDAQMGKRKSFGHIQSPPAVFLLAHGLELTLKAYLLHKEMTIDVLGKRPFGHNLKRLRREAKARGLDELYRGKAAELRAVLILDALNVRHQQRYIESGATVSLPWDDAEQYAVRLHQQVAKALGAKTLTRTYPVTRD
jgi:hypothetical protein